MKVRDVIRKLEQDGWRLVRTKGSHRQFQHAVKSGYGAYVPDLPGCVAAADTRREVMKLIREGIQFHLDAMRAAGEAIPQPVSKSEIVKIKAA